MKIHNFMFTILTMTWSGALMAVPSDEIPVVPATVLTKSVPAPMAIGSSASGVQSGASLASTDGVLHMAPGVNQIVPIAVGHPNRIVTPFSTPEVVSTSLAVGSGEGECGEICIKENVVYVATTSESPVTMFITEKGSESKALSLTMVPQRIPPREIFLKLQGQYLASASVNRKAQEWEESQPYVDVFRSVFRSVALGKVPQGYSLHQLPKGQEPFCEQAGLVVRFANGQMMSGHHFDIKIGLITNSTSSPIEFKEASCGDWNVAAVAAWPRNLLGPGESAEVYIATKRDQQTAPASTRPSLLKGGM